MKANAPDKIYLATTEEIQNLDSSFVGIAHSNPEDIIEPIEYIRKDVFIEKAWNWIEDNILSLNQQDKAFPYYEQFKNYMERE